MILVPLYDITRPHPAKSAQKNQSELNWKMIFRPLYSHINALSKYHLLRHLKRLLAKETGQCFEEVKIGVVEFFGSQPAQFW